MTEESLIVVLLVVLINSELVVVESRYAEKGLIPGKHSSSK